MSKEKNKNVAKSENPTEKSAYELFAYALEEKAEDAKAFICFAFKEETTKDGKKTLKALEPVAYGNVNIAYVAQKAKAMKDMALKRLEANEIAASCSGEGEINELLSKF